MHISLSASKLDLSNMGLTEIPSEIFKCKNLKKLNLSNNQIQSIPLTIVKLKYLRNLNLSNNNISSLMARFFELKNLEVLILNNNKIKVIPKQIGNLKKLTNLSLSSNQLTSLPKHLNELKALRSFNISNNLITHYPPDLTFPELEAIWLNKNPLQKIDFNQILKTSLSLRAIYCFSSLYSIDDLIDPNYALLQKKKGNALNDLKLLSLRSPNDTMQNRMKNKEANHKKNIFISYSHADKKWLDELLVPLKVLNYENLNIDFWEDTKIKAGDEWEKEIEQALHKADIAILLVSNNFLSSTYVRKKELPQILENAEERGTAIIPIVTRICRYRESPLSKFQTLNTPTTPLNDMEEAERDLLFYNLCERIVSLTNR